MVKPRGDERGGISRTPSVVNEISYQRYNLDTPLSWGVGGGGGRLQGITAGFPSKHISPLLSGGRGYKPGPWRTGSPGSSVFTRTLRLKMGANRRKEKCPQK